MTSEIFCPNTVIGSIEVKAGGEDWVINLHHIRKVREEPSGFGTLVFRFGEITTDVGFAELRDIVNAAILKGGGAYA